MDITLSKNRVSVDKGDWREITIFAAVIVAFAVYVLLSFAPRDWHLVWDPASRAFLSGESPYSIYGYFSPPWLLVLLAPLSFLPEQAGSFALSISSVILFYVFARRSGADYITTVAFLLSPFVLYTAIQPNVDSLVLVGLMLPAQSGLFFASIKPQLGIGIAAYWFVENFRKGKPIEFIRAFAPFVLVVIASIIVYGPWLITATMQAHDRAWNLSLFPYSVPLGIALLVVSLKRKRADIAMIASLFLSPYIGPHSLSVLPVVFLPSRRATVICVVALWIFSFARGHPFGLSF